MVWLQLLAAGCGESPGPEATEPTRPEPEPTPTASTLDTGPPPDPCDACGSEQVCDGGVCVDAEVLVYVNFDAEGQFTYDAKGPDAADNVQASNASLVGVLAGYGAGERRDEVLKLVRDDFAPWTPLAGPGRPNGIHVVPQRPEARTDYHMVVVTPNPPYPGQLGLGSPPNCGNVADGGVYFVFLSEASQQPDRFHANIIASAIGNLMGLGTLSEGLDTMSLGSALDFDLAPVDACLDLLAVDACPDFNAAFCPAGQQNTVAALDVHAGLEDLP